MRQCRLPAELVTVDLLRLEREEVVDVLIRLGRGVDRLAARVEPTAFEAAGIADVKIVVRIGLEVDRGPRRERLVGPCTVEVGGRRREDHADAIAIRTSKTRLSAAEAGLSEDVGRPLVIGPTASQG